MNSIAKKIYYGVRYFGIRATGVEWLFVLGHMRSGSSLLVHLLNSSKEILGYGETHLEYVGRRSFVNLHDHVRSQFEKHGDVPEESYRYVMDKILWPHIHNKNLLCQTPVKIIVIIRTPKEALPSILSLDLEGIQTTTEALDYYSKSLERIERNLEVYDAPFVLVRYETLTNRTELTLQKISEYLGLEQQIKSEYDTIWATGEPGIGDPSERIQEGQVVSASTSYEVDIEQEVLSKAWEQYRRFFASWRDKEESIA